MPEGDGQAQQPANNKQQTNNKQITSTQRATQQATQHGPGAVARIDGQSDFEALPDDEAAEIWGLLRPDGPDQGPRGGARMLPKPGSGLSKADALDDLMQRLADGQTIPSQEALADDWGRPKQTVSDWLREWRRIGIIPQPVQAGRCKATMGA